MSYVRNNSKRDVEIGFFQFQILLFLYSKDFYGYELLEELHMSGRPQLSSGSLYPTLRGLEKKGYLEGRHEESDVSPDRRIYSITNKGKEALSGIITFFSRVGVRMMWSGLEGEKEFVADIAGLKENETLIDFGESFGELLAMHLTPPGGKGYFLVPTIQQKNHAEKYLKRKNMQNIIPLLRSKDTLPSYDVAFFCFLHHSPNPRQEMGNMMASLKEGGRLIVVDVTLRHLPLLESFSKKFPFHENVFNEKNLPELFEEVGLKNVKSFNMGGFMIVRGEKP